MEQIVVEDGELSPEWKLYVMGRREQEAELFY
jgi:hypothetical protein